jgi:hypothetical protein
MNTEDKSPTLYVVCKPYEEEVLLKDPEKIVTGAVKLKVLETNNTTIKGLCLKCTGECPIDPKTCTGIVYLRTVQPEIARGGDMDLLPNIDRHETFQQELQATQ